LLDFVSSSISVRKPYRPRHYSLLLLLVRDSICVHYIVLVCYSAEVRGQ